MRIDCHAHGLHADKGPDGRHVPPLRMGWVPGLRTPAEHAAESRRRGIDAVVLLDPPNVCFPLQELFGDYVIPVPMVDMDAITPEGINVLLDRGGAGIKFICPMHSYGDNRYFPLYDVLRSRGALAVFHTGYLHDVLFRPGALLARPDYVDITHMRPAAVDRVARAFPDLNIVMAHFGNPWWEEAWNTIRNHRNVYTDISGGTGFRRPVEMWRALFTLDGGIDYKTVAKICFGVDGSACFQDHWDFQPLIEFYERFFEALAVPAELREQINHRTMARLTRSVSA